MLSLLVSWLLSEFLLSIVGSKKRASQNGKRKMNNVVDYVKIALVAFVGVFIINRALAAANLSQYKA